MILVAVFTPPPVAMYAPKGFRLFRAVVNENRTVNHTQSISLVYLYRAPYPPPSDAQRYAVGRNDDAVLRGTVAAKDDRARIVHNSTAT